MIMANQLIIAVFTSQAAALFGGRTRRCTALSPCLDWLYERGALYLQQQDITTHYIILMSWIVCMSTLCERILSCTILYLHVPSYIFDYHRDTQGVFHYG